MFPPGDATQKLAPVVAAIEFTEQVAQPPPSPLEKTVRGLVATPGTVIENCCFVTSPPFTASISIGYTPSAPGRAAPPSVAVPS